MKTSYVSLLVALTLLAAFALSIHDGIKRSLTKKLEAALKTYNAGETQTACDKLGSFIQELRAHSGKKVPEMDADRLIADAGKVTSAIGC